MNHRARASDAPKRRPPPGPADHLEELGFTITRDNHGHWHITTPDGTQIC